MKKYHRSYSTCAHVLQKKIMILSRSEYLVILTPHRYRRTSTTVSSPSVRGGPRPGDASRLFGHATTPPRMYEGPVRRSGGIATPLGHAQAPDTWLRGVPPLTDGATAGTWRGETDVSGLHGGDLVVGLARLLLQSVPMGRPNTTGRGGPLVKARPCKVKGLDPVVKRYRVRRDGALGG